VWKSCARQYSLEYYWSRFSVVQTLAKKESRWSLRLHLRALWDRQLLPGASQ